MDLFHSVFCGVFELYLLRSAYKLNQKAGKKRTGWVGAFWMDSAHVCGRSFSFFSALRIRYLVPATSFLVVFL
jgi:hypothetical protein